MMMSKKKTTKKLSKHELASLALLSPVGDKCQWAGTTYKRIGKYKVLQPCGAPTIGRGVFCDPIHKDCIALDICARHKGTVPGYEDDEGAWHL